MTHVPSTTEVRDAYVYATGSGDGDWTADRAHKEFNAWLSENNAAVAANALLSMAAETRVSDWYGPDVTNEHDSVAGTVRERLRARAARIARGESR
jgi:hypothetical protein